MQLMGIAALNPSYELCHRPETVIASEAKQSILPRKGRMDCFAALAMTQNTFTASPRYAPEALAQAILRAVARMERSVIRDRCRVNPGFRGACHRAALRADPLAPSGLRFRLVLHRRRIG